MKRPPRVVIVSLGPGDPGLVTVRAREVLRAASRVYTSGDAVAVAAVVQVLAALGIADENIARAAPTTVGEGDIVIAHLATVEAGADVLAQDYRELSGARVYRVPGVTAEAAHAAIHGLPLEGKRVLLLRAQEQAADAASVFQARGATPVALPAIEIAPPPDPARLVAAVREAATYAFIVFTSANGVRRFFDVLCTELQKDARALAPAKIAAIGPKTAEALSAYGVRADVVAKEFVGETLADELKAALGGAPARVLLPRALVARDVVPKTLRAAGHTVDVVAAYQTRAPSDDAKKKMRELLVSRSVDAICFTSSSTVTNTIDALGADAAALLGKICVASIGPVTTETAEKAGIRVDVHASSFTVEGLADALEDRFAGVEV